MAQTHSELFDGGLVTARDASTLREGELQRASDCIYHPDDPAIHKAPGRTEYNSSEIVGTTTPIKGLRNLRFDSDDDLLVAYANDGGTQTYFQSTFSGETGSFSSLATGVGDGETLDAVQYNDKYYLLNGNQDQVPNRVVFPDGVSGSSSTFTSRRHGMDPVTEVPTVASSSGSGWLGTDAGFGDGTYYFFYTEVIRTSEDEFIESAVDTTEFVTVVSVSAGRGAANISGTTDGVTVTKPSTEINSEATNWRIYLVGPKDVTEWNDSYLAEAVLQGEFDINQDTAIIGTNITEEVGTDSLPNNTEQIDGGWSNTSNVEARDSVGATCSTDGDSFECHDYGFDDSALTGQTILGIQVNVKAGMNSGVGCYLDFDLSWNGGEGGTNGFTAKKTILVPNGGWKNFVIGGKTDAWDRVGSWTGADDFDDGSFVVRVTFREVAATGAFTNEVQLDAVHCRVYFGDGNVITKQANLYPVTSIQVGNIISTVSSNGAPPQASTGDIFEGQLVTNDVSDTSIIRYSLPDNPDAFPPVYFLNFESREKDSVKALRTLNRKLIVGMEGQLYRVNFLPRSTDAEFDRGRAWELISPDRGMVSTQGVTKFTLEGGQELLAFVSDNGLHATDGFHVKELSEDIAWSDMVNTSKLSSSILVNYPKLFSLVFYYIPADDVSGGDPDSTYPTRALWFNYHPSQLKGNKLKVSGPTFTDNTAQEIASATVGRQGGETIMLTGHDDGHIYVEDRGFSDAANTGGINPDIVTREMYMGGLGNDVVVERLYVRSRKFTTATSTVTFEPYYRNLDSNPVLPSTNWTTKTFDTDNANLITGAEANLDNGGTLKRIDLNLKGEAWAWRFTESDGGDGVALSYWNALYQDPSLEEERNE